MAPGTVEKRLNRIAEANPHLGPVINALRPWLPSVNYITVHYAYFILGTLLFSLIFWASSQPLHGVSFADSLFMVTSAFTNTGLNSVDISDLTTWQQVLLWLLLILGSPITVSFVTVVVRRHAFKRRFEMIVQNERDMQRRRSSASHGSIGIRNFMPFSRNKADPVDAYPEIPRLNRKVKTQAPSLDDQPLDPAPTIQHPVRSMSAPAVTSGVTAADESSETETALADDETVVPSQSRVAFAAEGETRAQVPSTSIYSPRNQAFSHSNDEATDRASIASDESEDFLYHFKKFLGKHNVTRNGGFFDLTHEQREKLGGCEYRALNLLSFIVPAYVFIWMFFGSIALGGWISRNFQDPELLQGANSWWLGIFLAGAGFNNGGMSLLDANMVPFREAYFVLVVTGILVLAGNTAYPLLLRLILWTMLKVLNLTTSAQAYGPWKETIEFILKYPRRVYTTLFPSRATWWLLVVLLSINLVDWLGFEVLNIGNKSMDGLAPGTRVLGGLFQAIAVRAAGFVVIPLPSLYPGVLFLYVVMMYIAAYPVVITLRNSNIYEERSLGIFRDDPSFHPPSESQQTSFDVNNRGDSTLKRRNTALAITQGLKKSITFHGVGVQRPPKHGADESSRISFISQQIRGQLAHDIWWLTTAILIIIVIETDKTLQDPLTFSVFNILFEVVSAYGCVGLSLGLPDASTSFSGAWHTGSKVVLCLVMLRGRHRGLPVALDMAVRLPGERMRKEEEEDSNIRKSKAAAIRMTRELNRQS